ncbi:MAG: UvrD-helicase domain-containing protein [Gammaproteobacteria bacterium]|nr:UvrD-helicase domain-containing protein [Gammaproteobacteria bacterium]
MTTNTTALPAFEIPTTPALDLELYGMHLIEASAGTGKTWALSALIVRLLVERKLQTRQIVATTFTRAAAAELQDRIRKRIQEVGLLLQIAIDDSARATMRATDTNDVLGLSLLVKLSSKEKRKEACDQLKLALDTFDELFINTLDSFCQKILREFAFDTGQGEPREISEQEDELKQQLIHDALRQWRSQQDPRLIEMLVLTNSITDIEDHEGVVKTTLNFLSAEIAPVNHFTFAPDALTSFQSKMHDVDWSGWLEIWQRAKPYYYGGRIFAKNHESFPALVDLMQTITLEDLLTIDESRPEMKLLSIFEEQKFSTNFNKDGNGLDWIQVHLASSQSQYVNDFIQIRRQLLDSLKQAQFHLHHHISVYVREHLPALLAELNETTFAAQMHSLAKALEGESGQALAQQIRHRYPIALVDEFQDTNSDQDQVIRLVYRQSIHQAIEQNTLNKTDPDAPCLILVGDPKQAIYGFRGGDIHTYLSAKEQVNGAGDIHALDQNQRSVVPLVQAVNAFFSENKELGEGVDYPEVSPAARNHAPLIDEGFENPTPLRFVQLTEDTDELKQTAYRIIELLKVSEAGRLHIEGQAVIPQDIAVLAGSHRELSIVESELQAANIPVWRQSKTSVFQSSLTYDLAAIMQLMLSPYREDYFRRALSGLLIGKTLTELDTLEKQSLDLAEQQAAFAIDAQVWAKSGFLAAWQRIASRYEVWQRLAALGDAGEGGSDKTMLGQSGERHLVNLRHLIELLHRHSERHVGAHHLLAWLLRQIAKPSDRGDEVERPLPSHSGVQLMTIHGSKGLEFPIVFAVGLKDKKTKNPDVTFYLENQQRTLGFGESDQALLDQHHEREAGESRRLLYVALTRAKYRQYLFLKFQKTSKTKGQESPSFDHWLPNGAVDFANQHPSLVSIENPIAQDATWKYTPPHAKMDQLATRDISQRQFKSWGMTSFSALVRDVEPAKLAAAVDLPEYGEEESFEEETVLEDIAPSPSKGKAGMGMLLEDDSDTSNQNHPQPNLPLEGEGLRAFDSDDVRFTFQRGANAGNCLHQILEYMDPRFDENNPEKWTNTFAKQMKNFGIPDIEPDTLVPWFQDILGAPLPRGATLASLKFNARVREMEFHLFLQNERIDGDAIVQRLAQDNIPVPNFNKTHAIRYLKGFIDLVYEHDDQFYVADYKSNHLGSTMSDYSVAAMQDSMTHSGYWLQATLYLVALHRYLKVRKADYQIEKHLGGAVYLYLRGMDAESNQTGVVHWQPDPQLILDVDELLGKAGSRRSHVVANVVGGAV